MGFGEQRQKIWSCALCTCGTPSHHALVHLLDAFLCLPLLHQRPATEERAPCHPYRKSLFLRESNHSFGVPLSVTPLAAELMECGSKAQNKTQAIGVCALLRQRHRLVALCQPLLRIAKIPQHPGGVDVANHPG